MDTTPSIEEQPKQTIAAKVITAKRLYFLPHKGKSYKAESVDDAIAQSENEDKQLTNKKDEKVNDAK
jgi:hypothetical protein